MAHASAWPCCRPCCMNPEVVIIDEPMVGLDPQHARVVKDILKERSRSGATVLISTHQLSVAEEQLADRIGIIHRGRLIALGTPDELCRQDGHSGSLEKVFLTLTAPDADITREPVSNEPGST